MVSVLEDDQLDRHRLVQRVGALRGRCCRGCGTALCDHVLLFNVITGFEDDPTCTRCFATALGRSQDVVLTELRAFVDHRDCTRGAWEDVSRTELSCGLSVPASSRSPANRTPASSGGAGAPAPAADRTWDAGDLGCGDLVLELRIRLKALPPRAIFHLVARDPGAREDIPAWCGLTGHGLVSARHPDYYIRRKDD